MSSDDSDGPAARKRPRRAPQKRKSVIFSDDCSSDSDSTLPPKENGDDEFRPSSQSRKPGPARLRKNKAVLPPSRTASLISTAFDDNDDEEERKARRRSRLLELHQRSLNSPTAKTAERLAKAAPLSNMSEAAIAEHYGNCIKLAAENKINAKNAFNLHLIDYMNDLLQQDQLQNFQVASSSLDAGAKIYAGRVDAVHQDTFKVLGGLGRSKKDGNETQEDDAAPDPAAPAVQRPKKVNPKRKKNVIQKNLAKIRIKSVEFKTDVDPLFQHQAVAYDEGGTSELRLNNVFARDNSSELILDSDIQLMGAQRSSRLMDDSDSIRLLQLETEPAIRSVIGDPSGGDAFRSDNLVVCTAFADFVFTGWDNTELATSRIGDTTTMDDLAFDPNAEVEPCLPSGDISDVDIVPPDDNSVASGDAGPGDTSVYIGESKEAMLVQSAVDGMIQSSSTFVDSLRLMLTEQLNNRGQLHDNLLGMWAGPDHWRSKAKMNLFPNRTALQNRRASCSAVDAQTDASTNSTAASKRIRKLGQEKGYFSLDELVLGEDLCQKIADELKKLFRRGRAATRLSDQAVDKSMKRSYLLPPTVDYVKQSIIQLMNKKVLVLTRSESTIDGEVSDYNFNNDRDTANFCPPVDVNANENLEANDGPVDDIVDDVAPCGDDFAGDDDAEPFAGAFTQAFTGETQGQMELLSQPSKVAKIEIGYAKTAKRINVKFIKSIMWEFLTADADSGDNDVEEVGITTSSPIQNQVAALKVESSKKFSEMLQLIPNKVNKQAASDLSVPILLNCLLHLANEKSLRIENTETFDELIIAQGIAPPKHKERAVNLLRRNTAQTRIDEWMDTDDHS